MRKLVAASTLLFICLALTSCATSRPEDKFLGAWKGTYDGKPVEVEFLEPDIFIVKSDGQTQGGTWTLNADGNAQLTDSDDDDQGVATPTKDGRLIIRADETAIVLEKTEKQ